MKKPTDLAEGEQLVVENAKAGITTVFFRENHIRKIAISKTGANPEDQVPFDLDANAADDLYTQAIEQRDAMNPVLPTGTVVDFLNDLHDADLGDVASFAQSMLEGPNRHVEVISLPETNSQTPTAAAVIWEGPPNAHRGHLAQQVLDQFDS